MESLEENISYTLMGKYNRILYLYISSWNIGVSVVINNQDFIPKFNK